MPPKSKQKKLNFAQQIDASKNIHQYGTGSDSKLFADRLNLAKAATQYVYTHIEFMYNRFDLMRAVGYFVGEQRGYERCNELTIQRSEALSKHLLFPKNYESLKKIVDYLKGLAINAKIRGTCLEAAAFGTEFLSDKNENIALCNLRGEVMHRFLIIGLELEHLTLSASGYRLKPFSQLKEFKDPLVLDIWGSSYCTLADLESYLKKLGDEQHFCEKLSHIYVDCFINNQHSLFPQQALRENAYQGLLFSEKTSANRNNNFISNVGIALMIGLCVMAACGLAELTGCTDKNTLAQDRLTLGIGMGVLASLLSFGFFTLQGCYSEQSPIFERR